MNPQTQRTPCETFSRSMGYIRPVKNFNIGKYAEFCERKTFTEENSLSAGSRHRELLKKAASEGFVWYETNTNRRLGFLYDN